MQQARHGVRAGRGGSSRRTFQYVLDLHDSHAEHAALGCQARPAAKPKVCPQLASRQGHNHHNHRCAAVWLRLRHLQEAAQAAAAARLVAAFLASLCRQCGQVGGWASPLGSGAGTVYWCVCSSERACLGLRAEAQSIRQAQASIPSKTMCLTFRVRQQGGQKWRPPRPILVLALQLLIPWQGRPRLLLQERRHLHRSSGIVLNCIILIEIGALIPTTTNNLNTLAGMASRHLPGASAAKPSRRAAEGSGAC